VVYVPPRHFDLLDDLRSSPARFRTRTHDLASNGSPAQREHGMGAQVLRTLGCARSG
jgi:hypothetical protein